LVLQRAGHFVEPVDRAFLGADSTAQHQILMQCAAVQCCRIGELLLLESAVGVQQLGTFGAQGGDLCVQRRAVAVGGAAQLDGHLTGAGVAECTAPSGTTGAGPAVP
jgi:hypothetical protein